MNNEKGDPLAAGAAPLPIPQNLEGLAGQDLAGEEPLRLGLSKDDQAQVDRAQEDLARSFREHYRRVLAAAYRITGSMADAEDVAQAVFLRVAAGDGIPVANEGSYLYRAGINGALDLLRRRKTQAAETLDDAAGLKSSRWGSSPDGLVSNWELGELLRRAIGELAPRAAEMFALRYLEDFGNREIAAVMGTSQAVVAVTLHQARSRLKKRLRELQGEKR